MNINFKTILYLSVFCLLVGQASAFVITPVGDTHVVLQPGNTHTFTFSSDTPITGSTFYLNGVATVDGDESHEYIFPKSGDYYNVSVIASDALGLSNMITYNVITERAPATTKADPFDESNYNSIMENVENEDYEGIMSDSTKPFTDIIGRLFYLILFVLPFGLMWQRQQTLTIPVVLSLILGALLIAFVPENWKNVLIIAIALSYAYNLYMITRER